MSGTWQSGWATGDIVTAAEFRKGTGSVFDTILGASAATIDITVIPATYAHLRLVCYARSDAVAASVNLQFRLNGDVGSNYDWQYQSGSAAVPAAGEGYAANGAYAGNVPAASAPSNVFGSADILIPFYATSANKAYTALSVCKVGVASGNITVYNTGGAWRSTAVINRVTVLMSSGNFVAGTRVTLYALGA